MSRPATCARCGGPEPRRNGYCAACDRDRQAAAHALAVGREEAGVRARRHARLARIYRAVAVSTGGSSPAEVLRRVDTEKANHKRS